MKSPPAPVYAFGNFRIDTGRRLLWQDDAPLALTPRVFDTLLYLVEHHGTVLDKERLMEAVWPDTIVEENNLAQNISTLRRLLGETPGAHRFIATVPGRGYRFVAEVSSCDDPPSPLEEAAGPPANAMPVEARSPAVVPPPKSRPGARSFILLASCALVAVTFFLWRTHRPQPTPSTEAPPASATVVSPEKSIAVLPFENLSADPENAYFATGMRDEILLNLARISDLKVISRTSANLYKSGSPRNAREIGQQLGVAHLLEGSVQRAGDRVRVNAQLIDTRSDAHLWAQSYDRTLADVFAIQAEIAQTIAAQLQARISPSEKAAIIQAPTSDLVANALYAQATGPEDEPDQHRAALQAIHLLEEAVARDPRFMLAYCALARMHLLLYFGGYDHTPVRRELANTAIEQAARIQPDAGEVHLVRAHYWLHGFRDYDRARAELELARRTLPNDSKVYSWSAVIDRRQGHWDQALKNYERAIELDPRNIEWLINVGSTYERLRRYPEAAQLYQRALAIAPQDAVARLSRASLPLNQSGDTRPLRAELDAIVAEKPSAASGVADLLFYCALIERDAPAVDRALALIPPQGMAGNGNFVWPREWFVGSAARTFNDPATAAKAFTTARAILDQIVREQPDYHEAWNLLARTDAALGRKEEAIREGQRACELLPLSKDAWFGSNHVRALAWTYAWLGETDLALEQLNLLLSAGGIHYGELRLNPEWDSLRGDRRDHELLAALAPKEAGQ